MIFKSYSVFFKLRVPLFENLSQSIDKITGTPDLQMKLFGERTFTNDLATFEEQRKIDLPQIFEDKNLNRQQKNAVYSILKMESTNTFVLFGPPGTGKTYTLIQAIKHLLKNNSDQHFLICCPSNSAADNFTMALLNAKFLGPSEIHRFMATGRKYDARNPKLDCVTCAAHGKFIVKNEDGFYNKFKVIVSTIGTVCRISVPAGHFQFIIIDEAGQATEPDSWIPLGQFGNAATKFVLAGDPRQLGPVLIKPVWANPRYRYDQSLLRRLSEQDEYKSDW